MEILSVHTAVLIYAKSSGLWLRVLFQFNWTATKIQVCKNLRNGGLKVVSAVQWETYCRRIDAADYKMFETRLSQNFETYAPGSFIMVTTKYDSVKEV